MYIYVAREEPRWNPQLVRRLQQLTTVSPPLELYAGDYAFLARGAGQDGSDGMCGVEVKKAQDLASCVLYSARHLDQIRRMKSMYQDVILLIMDRIIEVPGGLACLVWKGGPHPISPPSNPNATIGFKRLVKHLQTLRRLMNVTVDWCDGPNEAAQRIYYLAEWWQEAPQAHDSWLAEYEPTYLGLDGGVRPILQRRVAAELDSIGPVRSAAVEQFVRDARASTREMLMWDAETWMRIKGIGKGIGHSIVQEVTRRATPND